MKALQGRLREVGLRATLPRVAVLRLLMRRDGALTHGEVAEELSGQGFDRATLYRNLMDLTEAGLVRREDIGDHVWRFELVRTGSDHVEGEHPHFICSSCGTVECLPGESVQVKPVRGAPRSLRGRGVQIQVRGLCNSCA